MSLSERRRWPDFASNIALRRARRGVGLRSLGVALFAIVFSTSACGDRPPTSVELPRRAISDGAHLGNEHFYFLPPMVGSPTVTGTPDGTRQPTVVVCEYAAGACGAVIASFSMTHGTGSEVIRYSTANNHYVVNWHTDRCVSGSCQLDPAKTYRVRVLVGAAELGHADVDIVSNGRELKNVETDEYIALLDGRTLPVKFRIEQGAVGVLNPGGSAAVGADGGVVASSSGDVAVEFSAGALGGSTAISANTISSPAPGPGAWAPVVDLGPDGQTFAAPVVVALRYDPAQLPPGVLPTGLRAAVFDGTGWEILPGSVLDEATNTVRAPLSHFSVYSLVLAPNSMTIGTGTPEIDIGTPATFTATATYTQVVQPGPGQCIFFASVGTYVCDIGVPSTINLPAEGVAVQWAFGGSDGVFSPVGTGPTYTNHAGVAVSPPVNGSQPGAARVRATVESAMTANVVNVFGRLTFDPGDRATTLGWNASQLIRSNVAPLAPLSLSVTNFNDRITVNEGGTANRTYGGGTGTYVLPAGATFKHLGVYAPSPSGVDTLVVSAPFFRSDTVIITTERGVFDLAPWPTTLAAGDSVAVQLTVRSQTGALGSLGYPLYAKVVVASGLSISDGTQPLDSVRIQQRTSSTFYVKATSSSGTGTLRIAHPDYDTLTVTSTLTPPVNPPAINPTPQGPFFQNLMIAAAGTSTTAVIPIANAGGGTLTGLNIGGTPRNCYSGAPVPWFTFAFDATTGPTNLRITVNVPAGTPVGDVDVCYFTIRATGAADYEYGARVRVQPAPAINPTPQGALQSLIQVLPGGSATAVVPIANAGGGTLTGLNIGGTPANCYSGQPIPWLTFTFDATTAPTNLRMTANVPAGTPYGSYDVCYFTIRATGAVDWNYGVRISVQEVVVPNGPFINPTPQAPSQNQMTVRAGETGSKDVPIANAGGAPLSGLALVGPVLNCFTGEAYTWLTHQWVGGTTAPTTLRLIASPPAGTPAGAISMCFELRARSAGAPDYRYGVVVNVQPGYTLSMGDMGTVSNGSSVASGINASGQVVGYANGLTALWSSPTATAASVVHPYGDLGYGFTINNAGVIAGRTPYTGFLYNTGTGTFQASPGAFPVTNRTWGHANNNTGLMLVCSDNGQFAQNHVWNPAANTNTLIPNSYNWCDGRLNDAGKVVVSDEQSGRARYFDAVTGTSTTIPTFNGRTVARDINNANIVVGSSTNASNQVRAFRWDPATNQMLDIGTLGGTEAEAFGINDLGWIVGWSSTATGARHAFARNPASGHLYDLGALGGYDQSGAMDISESLQVIGWSSVGNPGGLGGMPRTIGVITGTTRATRWRIQ